MYLLHDFQGKFKFLTLNLRSRSFKASLNEKTVRDKDSPDSRNLKSFKIFQSEPENLVTNKKGTIESCFKPYPLHPCKTPKPRQYFIQNNLKNENIFKQHHTQKREQKNLLKHHQ